MSIKCPCRYLHKTPFYCPFILVELTDTWVNNSCVWRMLGAQHTQNSIRLRLSTWACIPKLNPCSTHPRPAYITEHRTFGQTHSNTASHSTCTHPPPHTCKINTSTHTQRRHGSIPRHLVTVLQSQSGLTHLSLGEEMRGSKLEKYQKINRDMPVYHWRIKLDLKL